KALETAVQLLGQPAPDPARQVRLLYTVVIAIRQFPDASPEQLDGASKAARDLDAFDKIPAGVTPEAWGQTRIQLQKAARDALLYIAMVPGTRALKANACAAAAEDFRKVLKEFPSSAQAAGYLGEAELCSSKADPQRLPVAIYEFARAASLDPGTG